MSRSRRKKSRAKRFPASSMKRSDEGDKTSPSVAVGVHKKITRQVVQKFSGPLPPPELLKTYGELMPDLPERIVAMVEKEQAHKHNRENKTMEYVRNDVRRGQILGVLVSLGSLATAGFCAWIGAPWIVVLGTILPGLSTVFYWLLRRFAD